MKLATLTLLAALTTGCSLDANGKPECVTSSDCAGTCIEHICTPNAAPTPTDDIWYIPKTESSAHGYPLANDSDPENDPLTITSIYDEDGQLVSGTWDNGDVRLSTTTSQTFTYFASDGLNETEGAIRVEVIDTRAVLRVAPNVPASVYAAFPIADVAHRLSVVTPPQHGHIVTSPNDLIYEPEQDYCGPDTATVHVQGDNESFDVPLDIAFELFMPGLGGSFEYGSTFVVDVNDLEFLYVNSPYAEISADRRTVTVTPPPGLAKHFDFIYTARDARGCTGTGHLGFDMVYPTKLVAGWFPTEDSLDPALSGDARYVAFTSAETSFVENDMNGMPDVFVLDMVTGVKERVSIASDGTEANGSSTSPSISADGRYVVFSSTATNLDAADTSSVDDIYVHDRLTGITSLVSRSIDDTGSNQPSITPQISADGSTIVFASTSTRLISGDTNTLMDVFVRDRVGGPVKRVSVDANGNQVGFASGPMPRISGDGHFVVFVAQGPLDAPASIQSGTFVVDATSLGLERISNTTGEVDIDSSARHVLFGTDGGSQYVRDRVLNLTTMLDVGFSGAISADGRCTAIAHATGIQTSCGETALGSVVDTGGTVLQVRPLHRPAISSDGQWIVFATNEWPGPEGHGHYVIVRIWNRAFGL